MESFKDYWKKKSAKQKKNWVRKNEKFAAEHTLLEHIRGIVFVPIDYDRRGYDSDAFINTYFKATNPFAQWDQGVFRFSEFALQKAMEEEGADMKDFTMEVDRVSIRGLQAPAPKITDYGTYKLRTSCTNRVFYFRDKYHAWLRHIYKVCTDMETATLNYRQVTMTIKRYTMPDMPFAYYEINPCVQLMKSPLLMEETGFSVLNVAFLLMDMAAEWELRQEEFGYYAKQQKIRKMDAVTTDGIDLDQWKGLDWAEKLKTIKTLMDSITEMDCTNRSLDIPIIKFFPWGQWLEREMKPFLRHSELQEVKASYDEHSRVVMDYQGHRAVLCERDNVVYFYPRAENGDGMDPWHEDKGNRIEFKRLTKSAITGYLKLIPKLWPMDNTSSSDEQEASPLTV